MPKVRTTLSLDESVLEQFKQVAFLEQASLSSVVNDWLREVAESAIAMAQSARDAHDHRRQMLKRAIVVSSAAGDASLVIDKVKGSAQRSLLARDAAGAALPPRPVIRGGNSTEKGGRRAA